MRILFLAALTCLVWGCASTGNYIEPKDAKRVSRAKTGQDVIKTLGPPSVTVATGNGKTLWVYVGQHKSPSLDSFIPYVGAITGRENQICSQLTMLVDDKTGAVSNMKYSSAKDSDWQYNTDERCN